MQSKEDMSTEKYTTQLLTNTGLASSSTKPHSQLLLKDYKIDFNKCLGGGVFGNVYRVVLRPENEKGFWSNWFPHIYDYIYRVYSKPKDEESKKYCVKIFKPAIQILYENSDHPLPLRRPLDSLFGPSEERKTNQILNEKGITGITFFNTKSWYSQLKTRVRGKTLKFYLHSGHFYDPEQFVLRKSFVDFLRRLQRSNLALSDIHSNNLMYDKHRQCWEIIDGSVMELDPNGMDWEFDSVSDTISRIAFTESNPKLQNMFNIAKGDLEYTIEKEQELLEASGDSIYEPSRVLSASGS
jgi:hypothetical protein